MASLEVTSAAASIIDIRREDLKDTLRDDIRSQLNPPRGGEKKLPTLLLYDERGLKLFEKITYIDEYYLTNAEIQVLNRHAQSIADRVPQGALVVELGSGNLRKVDILLRALDKARKDVDYFALDLDRSELERTLAAIPSGTYEHVRCHGLHGTYDDGLAWLKSKDNSSKPKCVTTLGSSIGNFDRPSAGRFLKGFADILGKEDILLVGLDGCADPDRVYHAYNDKYGITHEFVRNGLRHANRIMGANVFDESMWDVIGEFDTAAVRHHAFVSPRSDVVIDGAAIRAGERVRIEESYKYTPELADVLWQDAGLSVGSSYGDSTGTYHIMILSKSEFAMPRRPEQYAAVAVPSIEEWEQLWTCWDLATRKMLPEQDMLSKPIKLRHCCVFYLGHIPTFLDMKIAAATDGKNTEPAYYPRIFERGIDPDVENPEQCHDHSEVPDEWPPLAEILQYQQDVRARVRSLYEAGAAESHAQLRRVLPFGFEHEVMHLETFLYMLLQSDHVIAPPGVKPDFEALADDAERNAGPSRWVKIPKSDITIGRNDADDNYTPGHFFSWDVEYPARRASVHEFEAANRPLTNADYARYLVATGAKGLPASWSTKRPDSGFSERSDINGHSHANGDSDSTSAAGENDSVSIDNFVKDKTIRTVYGVIPLRLALHWPVSASYDELHECAQYFGGRIPTFEEARSIYTFAEQQRLEDLSHISPETIPAVNGQLSNNGVHQTPPSHSSPSVAGSGTPSPEQVTAAERAELFADLSGLNVGFNHYHPQAVTARDSNDGLRLCGMGGLWEWTSTPLQQQQGFKPMDIYPAYSADFYDGRHNIVLGGSWATHPRLAGRKSSVNWYQRKYPYVWAGARLVRDV